jgi:hypothetical protein
MVGKKDGQVMTTVPFHLGAWVLVALCLEDIVPAERSLGRLFAPRPSICFGFLLYLSWLPFVGSAVLGMQDLVLSHSDVGKLPPPCPNPKIFFSSVFLIFPPLPSFFDLFLYYSL